MLKVFHIVSSMKRSVVLCGTASTFNQNKKASKKLNKNLPKMWFDLHSSREKTRNLIKFWKKKQPT
jgi:hypothetical protein